MTLEQLANLPEDELEAFMRRVVEKVNEEQRKIYYKYDPTRKIYRSESNKCLS